MTARQETYLINRQAYISTLVGTCKPLDEAAIDELERLLSTPLDYLVLKVLDIEHYYDLLTFLTWDNRFQVDVLMLTAVQVSGKGLMDVCHIE